MKLIVLSLALLLATMWPGHAATPNSNNLSAETNANPETAITALFGDSDVVKAKGFTIKRSDLDQLVSAAHSTLLAANQQIPQDLDIRTLEQLITIQVLLQIATPADRVEGKAEADEQYTNLLAQFRTKEDFLRILTAKGMTENELRAKATQEATAKAALKRALNINITDDAARDYYNQHPSSFEQPEQIHARHILLMTIDPSTGQPLNTNTIASKRKQIEDIRKRLLAGEDFATLARQYSEDPGSKADGGDLPVFSRGRMVAEFESAAFALPTNTISEVVTTQYGFHLIKVLEKFPAKKIEFAKAESEIKDYLGAQKIGKLAPDYVKKLRADQQVQIQDPNLKAQDEQVQTATAAAMAAQAEAGATNQ